MNREKERWRLNATLRAINPGRFKRHDFSTAKATIFTFYPVRMNRLFLFLFCCFPLALSAQVNIDRNFADNIGTVKFYAYGNQTAYPVITLGSNDRLELHFDDLTRDVKNYSYTFQLCNADWTPAMLNTLDYIKGYTQMRITNYRSSSVALTRYTHYQAEIPDRQMQVTKSGNYILKVFLNGDTSKLAFVRRFLVVQQMARIAATVQQPYNSAVFRTHQKVQFTVNAAGVNAAIPNQQIKVTILQNNRWDNAAYNLTPTFVRMQSLEYNTEQQSVFPAGREWRWLDLRSFRLQSDRVKNAQYKPDSTNILLRPDPERRTLRTAYYRDTNGMFYIETMESVNPFWQGDYANVRFSFAPADKYAYTGKSIFLFGELTQYGVHPNARMRFNEETGMYETTLFLKQGYYDYQYLVGDKTTPTALHGEAPEGDNWETENTYTILVYYRPFGGRYDELVGLERVNSIGGRPGL